MGWDLEGKQIFGSYLGEFDVSGTVTLSRITLGGRVHHHIKLDSMINVYGSERDSVIIEHKYVTKICDINCEYV